MLNLDPSRLFLLFLIYSCIGYVCEVAYCSSLEKRFVDRGFLHGPICPIYGFGALLVLSLLQPWSTTWVPLYIAAVIVTSVLEYVTSWVMEALFHTKWWDYSKNKFNINGRVCLLNSLLFGVMAVAAVHFVQPVFDHALRRLSDRAAHLIAWALLAVFAVDLLDTVKSLVSFNVYLARLKEFTESLKERYEKEPWFAGSSAWEWIEASRARSKANREAFSDSLRTKLEQFYTRHNRIDYLVRKFPTMRSPHYSTQMEALRTRIERNVQERREQRRARREAKRGAKK